MYVASIVRRRRAGALAHTDRAGQLRNRQVGREGGALSQADNSKKRPTRPPTTGAGRGRAPAAGQAWPHSRASSSKERTRSAWEYVMVVTSSSSASVASCSTRRCLATVAGDPANWVSTRSETSARSSSVHG